MIERSESTLAPGVGESSEPARVDGSEPSAAVDCEQPWEPAPLPASAFETETGWANINRSPYDRVSGVLYKPAMAIKAVRHEPLDSAPELPELWQGRGATVVRWLFSEEPGTEEGILQNRSFRALQTLQLAPDAATGRRHHPGRDTILLVLEGNGKLRHQPAAGAPVVQRPLRTGDAVLIDGDERYSLTSGPAAVGLKVLVLHLAMSRDAEVDEVDG